MQDRMNPIGALLWPARTTLRSHGATHPPQQQTQYRQPIILRAAPHG